jgi:uncharacterized membrane protein YcfT
MDTAKGLCILLVVSWHVIWKSYLHIDWGEPGVLGAAWSVFGRSLLPMRMPLFFLISGMLATSAVTRKWRVVARDKVAGFGYLYLVWLLVHTAVLFFLPIPFDTEMARSAGDLIAQATILPTALWYLYGLALYFVIAKLVRKLPAPLVLAVAFALSTASAAGWIYSPANNASLYQNLFFFLAGLYLRPHVEEMARWSSWWQVVGTGLSFLVCLVILARFNAMDFPGVWPATSIVATLFAVLAMAKIARWRTLRRPLAALGRRTLPIYVMHLPLLAYVHWLLAGVVPGLPGPLRLVLAVVEPVLLTVALVATCLAAHHGLVKAGAGWLFAMPVRNRRTTTFTSLEMATEPIPTILAPRRPDASEMDDWPTTFLDDIPTTYIRMADTAGVR